MILVAGLLASFLFFHARLGYAQAEKGRLVKTKVPVVYPELARQSNLVGTVKLQVIVAPNGHVKKASPIGGNPVLVQAAMDAVKHWEFEPAKEETTEVVAIKFQP